MRRLMACVSGFLALAAPACAAPSAAGTWFGIGQYFDRGEMYIDRMLPDGRIYSSFRTCIKGKPQDNSQEGTWSISGDKFVIQVNTLNGRPSPRTDNYQVQSLTERNFNYLFLPLKFPFKARRVAQDYKMPSCDFIS